MNIGYDTTWVNAWKQHPDKTVSDSISSYRHEYRIIKLLNMRTKYKMLNQTLSTYIPKKSYIKKVFERPEKAYSEKQGVVEI